MRLPSEAVCHNDANSSARNRLSASSRIAGILANGFKAIGWSTEVAVDLTRAPPISHSAPMLLVQLHGAPHSRDDDQTLLALLAALFKAPAQGLRLAALVHRPDELPLHHADFRATFDLAASAAPPVSLRLVFMGDAHINDACYALGPSVTVQSRHR